MKTQNDDTSIPVQYTNDRGETPEAMVAFADFESAGQGAEPTSRVLSGSSDHGYAEEWRELGSIVINGERRPVRAVYLFDEDEISDEADNYPWDAGHVVRFLLAD